MRPPCSSPALPGATSRQPVDREMVQHPVGHDRIERIRRLEDEMLKQQSTKRSASAETLSRRLDVALFNIDAYIFAIG